MSIDQYTKCLMHFDSSPTRDECGNTWTANGTPTISDNAKFGKALQLDGNSYIWSQKDFVLYGQDFTVDGWVYIEPPETDSSTWCSIFSLYNDFGTYRYRIQLEVAFLNNATRRFALSHNSNVYKTINYDASNLDFLNQWIHFAVVYQAPTLYLYINGQRQLPYDSTSYQMQTFETSESSPSSYKLISLGLETSQVTTDFKGYIDEFRISDGIARWTEDFTPPTAPTYFGENSTPLTTLEQLENAIKRVDGKYIPVGAPIEVELVDYLTKSEASDTYVTKAEYAEGNGIGAVWIEWDGIYGTNCPYLCTQYQGCEWYIPFTRGDPI